MAKSKFWILFISVFLGLIGCKFNNKVIVDNLPDSLFAYRQIVKTYGFEDTLKHNKKLTKVHYIQWIKPYLEQTYNVKIDTSRIMMDDYFYISKTNLNSSYNSFIIEAIGDDMEGLILFTIDKNGNYVDSYHLAGVIGCSGAWQVDSSYYETCKLTDSRFENSSIITNIKRHYFKPINDSVNLVRLDSINYKIEINNNGKFISSKLDSGRIYRYENNK